MTRELGSLCYRADWQDWSNVLAATSCRMPGRMRLGTLPPRPVEPKELPWPASPPARGHPVATKAPSGDRRGLQLGAAYRNRTDDLFITRSTPLHYEKHAPPPRAPCLHRYLSPAPGMPRTPRATR